eukprot:COSAG01_NODE_3300_length_6296_cov_45.595449_2_plen_228_part_00
MAPAAATAITCWHGTTSTLASQAREVWSCVPWRSPCSPRPPSAPPETPSQSAGPTLRDTVLSKPASPWQLCEARQPAAGGELPRPVTETAHAHLYGASDRTSGPAPLAPATVAALLLPSNHNRPGGESRAIDGPVVAQRGRLRGRSWVWRPARTRRQRVVGTRVAAAVLGGGPTPACSCTRCAPVLSVSAVGHAWRQARVRIAHAPDAEQHGCSSGLHSPGSAAGAG